MLFSVRDEMEANMNTKIQFIIPAILAMALSACSSGGPAEFRDHTNCGVRMNGVDTCPSSSQARTSQGGGVGESPMKIEMESIGDSGLYGRAWFHDPNGTESYIVRTPVPPNSGVITYDAALHDDILGRVVEFGEINGRAVVSAVDIEDGSFVANFATNKGRLELEKPYKDYAATTIVFDDISLTRPVGASHVHTTPDLIDSDSIAPDFPHPHQTGLHTFALTGGSASGTFQQIVADSSPRHPFWKSGGPTWVSHRSGVFHIGVNGAEE